MRLDELSDLYRQPGPFLSVYFDVSRQTAGAAHELETRWRDTRKQLLDQGAPAGPADEVGRRIAEPTGEAGRNARMVVATEDGVWLDDRVTGPPCRELAAWSALPDLGPWISDSDAGMAVLVVVADHLGAELEVYQPWPGNRTHRKVVEGSTETLHKARHPRVSGRMGSPGGPGGGPSGERLRGDMQRHTDEVWRQNARLVAAEIERLAPRASLRVLAGDPRACAEIRDAVSPAVASSLVTVEHGTRVRDGSEGSLDHDVEEAIRDAVIADRLRLVHEFQERQGRGQGHAAGIQEVLEAMVLGQVETLLLDPDESASIRIRPADVEGLELPSAVDPSEPLPGDQVAVAAAARTGAAVRPVGSRALPPDGIAALLRWSA